MGVWQQKRGKEVNLPELESGEFYFAEDTLKLFLGTGDKPLVFKSVEYRTNAFSYHFMGSGSVKFPTNGKTILNSTVKVGTGNLIFEYASDVSEDYSVIDPPSTSHPLTMIGGSVLRVSCDDGSGNTAFSVGYV